MVFAGDEWWLSVSGDTMTALGDAGDGRRGSPPPRALLRLPPLMFCGGIVGQLKTETKTGVIGVVFLKWCAFFCSASLSRASLLQ